MSEEGKKKKKRTMWENETKPWVPDGEKMLEIIPGNLEPRYLDGEV